MNRKNIKMNSRERVFTVLEGRIPDRVPIFEMYVASDVIQAISPCSSYYDFAEWVGFDAVCTTVAIFDPDNINWIDKQKRIARDKWGASQVFTEEFMPLVIPPPRIQSEEDIVSYAPPDPDDINILNSVKALVNRFKGKKAIVLVGEAVFAPSQYLRGGLENLLIDYKTNPDLVKKLAKIGEEYYIELYRRLIKEGVEIVLLGDDYAGKTGPFMSPADFEQFILPGLSRVVREIKRAGAYCIKHTDGDLWKILDQIVSTGIDALGPLEPVPGFDLDLIKKRYGNKVAVMGNIEIDLLSRGSGEDVIKAIKACIAKASPGGGHILSSANTISSSVKPENFMAMVKTVKEWGHYPINVKALSLEP